MPRIASFVTAASLALVAACYSAPDFPSGVIGCSADGECPEGQSCALDDLCYDDGTGPTETCEPDSVVCEDDALIECNASGSDATRTDCPSGCHETEPRCNEVVFSNDLEQYLPQASAAASFTVGSAARFDTRTGIATDADGNDLGVPSVEHIQGDESTVTVFLASSLTVSGDITVVGIKPAAFVVSGPIVFEASLERGLGRRQCSTPFFSMEQVQSIPGTPGGSLGARGGAGGGTATESGLLANLPDSAAFEPLRGGCTGTAYENPIQELEGGAGGGAIRIASAISIELASASVSANGGGGPSSVFPGEGLGTGGGSGGVILLEAPSIRLLGEAGLFANCGGGGCASASGSSGISSLNPAQGANCIGHPGNSGSGGAGGALGEGARSGVDGTGSGGGGGGGGSVGLIRLNTRGEPSTSIESVFSPLPSQESLQVR